MQTYIENIIVALGSIKDNLLRSILTILIISIGITSLIGILSAIDAVKSSINENFTSMGANTFNIKNTSANMRMQNNGSKGKRRDSIKSGNEPRGAKKSKENVRGDIRIRTDAGADRGGGKTAS